MPSTQQTPEQRAAEIAAMREAERLAMEELKANPQGVPAVPTSQEDIELLAMLAGSTAQEMRKSRFGDSTTATMTQTPVDPKAVVSQFVKGAVVQPAAPRSPGVAPIVRQPEVLPTVERVQKKDDPQLELDLFRNMNMNDVYNMLSTMKERLDKIEDTQKVILDFIKKVEAE